ncbi:MAG: anti-sigma 24 factor, partial [Rubrivivax sp.]|nr:anti-sigma 24 factor [Rubrivivax sp.]
APQTAQRSLRQVWALPLAVAAGFMAVAGVLVVLQQVGDGGVAGEGQVLAAKPATGPQFASAAVVPGGAEGRAQMLRDARVDEYLQMHRQALAGSPVALPGGAMRSVDLTMPLR